MSSLQKEANVAVSLTGDLNRLMMAAVERYDDVNAGSLLDDDDTQFRAASIRSNKAGSFTPLNPSTAPEKGIEFNDGKANQISTKKAEMRANRRLKRDQEKHGKFTHIQARSKSKKKHVSNSTPAQSEWDTHGARVASTGYIGLREQRGNESSDVLGDLVGPNSKYNFKLIPYVEGRPVPIVSNDKEKRIVGVMAGCPKDKNWDSVMREASQLLENARGQLALSEEETIHRRGKYATLRCGVSMGGGQPCPMNLRNNTLEDSLVKDLNSKEPFKRLAGFATSIVASWAPSLYEHYVENLELLHQTDPSLERNSPSTIFAATTYNLGPHTATLRHVDYFNLPYGWCAITALGNFDYKKGGHLVLWDLGLVFEFPPGTTILIPSAVVSHSNVKIQPGETRQSFTQYTAGGIFRWIGNDFQKATKRWKKLSKKQRVEEKIKDGNRWKAGLNMWSKMEDLDLNGKL